MDIVGKRKGCVESLAGEEWRPVVGYDDVYTKRYLVSNMGRIVSLCWRGVDGWVHIMTPTKTRGGYCKVRLSDGCGNTSMCELHRLVALAFIDNPDSKPWVNHIDENPSNNVASNLEWATPHENNVHKDVHIRRAVTRSRAVVMCDLYGVEQTRFRSACNAVCHVGSGKSKRCGHLVTDACKRHGGYAYGYRWWYADEFASSGMSR